VLVKGACYGTAWLVIIASAAALLSI